PDRSTPLLRAAFLVTLLIAGSIPYDSPFLPLEPAAAQSQAPWWGPVDGANPKAEWHMRVPLSVENPEREAATNPTIVAELDLAKVLREAGWPTVGDSDRLSGFTLDEKSLRLIEYTPGWGSIRGDGTPVPVAFEGGFREGGDGEYDPAENPQVTVTWVAKGTLEPAARRYYYLYFDSLEAGLGKDALKAKPEDLALVAARGFGGAAVEFYGRELGSTEGAWDLIATVDRTTVTVYTLDGGVPELHVPTGGAKNPLTLNAGQREVYDFPRDTPFKVVADKPILVGSRGTLQPPKGAFGTASYAATAYVPSLDKGFAGRAFLFPAYAPRAYVMNTGSPDARVTVTDLGTGLTSTLTVPTDGYQALDLNVLDGGRPRLYRLQVTQGPDVLVQYAGTGAGLVQVPTVDGTPEGVLLRTFIPDDGALTVVAPKAAAKARILDAATGQQVLPEAGSLSRTRAEDVGPGLAKLWRVPSVGDFPNNPVEVFSSTLENPGSPQNPLAVFTGKGAPVSPFGAQDGRTFTVLGGFQVFAPFNGTAVKVQRYRDGRSMDTAEAGLDRDGAITDADLFGVRDANARFLVTASKPVSVVPVSTADAYGRFLSGRPAALPATAEAAEYRGALVSLTATDRNDLSKVTSLNRSVTYRFTVENRGRGHLGANLRDEITLSHTLAAPPGSQWRVTITPPKVTLDSGERANILLSVTPEANIPLGSEATLTLKATSGANPRVSATELTKTVVQERRDVALFFVGGLCPLDGNRCQQTVDNGQRYRYDLLLVNRGTVRDTIDVSRSDPGPGWTAEVQREGSTLREITLEPGDGVFLELVGLAPPRGNLVSNSEVAVVAESRADPSKNAKVSAITSITRDLNISISSDDPTLLIYPGKSAVFNVTLANTGSNIFTFRFSLEGILPQGWAASFTTVTGEPIDEINLNPDDRFPLRLRMTAAKDAIAGERYTQKLGVDVYVDGSSQVEASRQLILTALVGQVHNLTVDTLGSLDVRPGPDATVSLVVRNRGNGPEVLTVKGARVPVGWVGPRAPDRVSVAPGEDVTIPVRFSIPESMENGTYPLELRVVSSDFTETPLAKTVRILGTAALELTGGESLVTAANANRTLPYTLRNVGNMRFNVTLRAEVPGSGAGSWIATPNPRDVELGPGEAATITLSFLAPAGTPEGRYQVRLVAESRPRELGGLARHDVNVDIRRPDLTVLAVSTAEGQGATAGLTLVTATLRNDGDIEARGVSVGLYRGDQRVDNVTLALLAPGQTALATMKLPATEGGALSVRVDADGSVDEANEDNNAFALQTDARTPGPVLVAAVAALALAALALRGRRGAA
ncbi:MAG TPA: CARDB domain-containing protein, partial [Candidatus Thermoplasmatota archaeon]|nr:CARDB domain-containing protein [Candidatus Thermoplasmatota archaeon]